MTMIIFESMESIQSMEFIATDTSLIVLIPLIHGALKLIDGHEETHVPNLSGRSVIFPADVNNGRRWTPDVWVKSPW